MRFDRTISAFAGALADSSQAPPTGTVGRERAPDTRRFSIYRNNIAIALIAAIEARYPVARRLVGEDFFRAMTRAFVARNKPRSAVILHYGVDFPDFVAGFKPARAIAYLADVMRIEDAWVESYHAAEDEALDVAALGEIDPSRVADLRLIFHPAARLLSSDHPAASIWAAHQGEGDVKPPEHWRGEEALVARPHAEVLVRRLPAGGYAFAHSLKNGATLAEAHAAVDLEGFDPGQHLIGLIEAGAVSRLQV
jgi:Putative DNA-binding domain